MKKIIIFDLDGVLINSKRNMFLSWTAVKKKHKLEQTFQIYFENIGAPFQIILKKIEIKNKNFLIEKIFKKNSIKNFNKITLYSGVLRTLKILKKQNILGLLTSKDKQRTLKLLKKFKIYELFDFIECPDLKFRGKPYPDQINKQIKNYKIKKRCLLCWRYGIRLPDCKNAGVNFIFASYGYGKLKKVRKIIKFPELIKINNENE